MGVVYVKFLFLTGGAFKFRLFSCTFFLQSGLVVIKQTLKIEREKTGGSRHVKSIKNSSRPGNKLTSLMHAYFYTSHNYGFKIFFLQVLKCLFVYERGTKI